MSSNADFSNHFYIGGEWVRPSSDRRFTLINADTEEVLGSSPEAMEADVDRAVAAAREAFDHGPWGRSTPAERIEVMNRFIGTLAKRSSEIARAVSVQNGMPVSGVSVYAMVLAQSTRRGLPPSASSPGQFSIRGNTFALQHGEEARCA